MTPSSVTVAWKAATDNVGVTSYAVTRDGNAAGTVTAPSAVVDGLSCGTSYTVGVVAIDAADNKSAPATLAVQTSTCPPVDIPASVFLSPNGNDAGRVLCGRAVPQLRPRVPRSAARPACRARGRLLRRAVAARRPRPRRRPTTS